MNELLIKKSDGSWVPFSLKKLERSLFRAGASPELINQIANQISSIPQSDLSTRLVYKEAFRLLRAASYQLAARYKLKKAILELGPTGYPFEEYISHLFAYQGFEVETGVVLQGKRVTHEVDVWARNEEREYLVECKHHRTPSYKSDIKVVLYVHSRFNDVSGQLQKKVKASKQYHCWVVCNTRFTSDAIDYASGENIKLMSWDFPGKGSLKERIDISGLYPITCLCSLTKAEKKRLLDQKVVLCRQLILAPNLLEFLPKVKLHRVLSECEGLSEVNSSLAG